jgi:hypothetical protein
MASAGAGSDTATSSQVQETVDDPRWFPLRFDANGGNYHFALIPAELHREIAFLRDVKPAQSDVRVIPRSAISTLSPTGAPLHLIMHSGLGGSTFLARTLAQAGVAVPLQEPPILTDVIGYGLRRSAADANGLLAQVSQLLARPFAAGEAVVCKLSGIANGLALRIAVFRPNSRLICLENPLEHLLASFASRGASGRMAGRQQLLGLRNSRMMAFEMTDRQLLDHTDFQLAALAWLSIQKLMLAAAEALGPARVRSISTEELMRDPVAALSAVSTHLGLALDADAVVAKGHLGRHAKSGAPFDAKARVQKIEEALRMHGPEIEAVVGWARKVAETTGIAWDLPYPVREPTV